MPKSLRWEPKAADDDYGAATRFLRMLMPEEAASSLAGDLSHAPVLQQRANDLLRASGLLLLPPDEPEVAKDLKKVKKGTRLSPVLVVRGTLESTGRPLTVVDGYHRICASYHLDPDAEVPCQIADLPA